MIIEAKEIGDVVRRAFNFEVTKQPLTGPDNTPVDYFGLFRSDNFAQVGRGSVTDSYYVHKSQDVVTLAEAGAQVFDGVADLRCKWKDGHHVVIQPTSEHRQAIFGTEDNIFPRIWIRAGYAGTGSFNASLGVYHDLCRNEMEFKSIEEFHISIKHTSGLPGRMEELLSQFRELRAGWQNMVDLIKHMDAQEVALDEFVLAVYGEPKAGSRIADSNFRKRAGQIMRRVRDERFRSGRPSVPSNLHVSAWEAYNAVQGYEQHDVNRRGDNIDSFDRITRANDSQAVRTAEKLALAA